LYKFLIRKLHAICAIQSVNNAKIIVLHVYLAISNKTEFLTSKVRVILDFRQFVRM